jgi:VWFA-related protein
MKKILWLIFILIFSMGLGGARQEQTIKVRVNQVYLQVRLFDNGRAPKLNQENFRIWEEGQNAAGKVQEIEQSIEGFARYESVPLALGVVVDSSGSMGLNLHNALEIPRNKLEMARNAARHLFDAIFREGHDRGLVGEFYFETPRLVYEQGRQLVILTNLIIKQDWTSTLGQIHEGLGKITKAGGATPLRDSSFNLARHFQDIEGDYLRIAVVLSDEEDASDKVRSGQIRINLHSLEEVISELQTYQVTIFAVGLYKKSIFDNLKFGRGQADIMDVMAQETGGEAFHETDLAKLSDIFLKIGERIREANFISYIPKSDVEGHRTIRVEVGEWSEKKEWRQKKISLHHRQGYYYRTKD